MTKRIFRSTCLVVMGVFLACLVLIMGVMYDYFTTIQQHQLREETELAAQGVALTGEEYLADLDTERSRITWIAQDGTVLYDSHGDTARMESHLERQEVIQAMAQGYGESVRYSTTSMERLLYSAQLLPDGSVIRLSVEQDSILTLILSMLQPMCVVVGIALVLALVLADRVAKQIVKPLNELNLDEPHQNGEYDELAPLLRRIDSQQRQLKGQSIELHRRQQEFDTITNSMGEGLVLLNVHGRILSMNPMAARLLGADESCVGKDILAVSRDPEVLRLISRAREGERGSTVLTLEGAGYELDVNPVFSEDLVTGVVILLFDVTEKERAEQMRREFTANVSHELKTPLHTISGCAELLTTGLVRPEDEKQFAGQIYSEAQRMIRLVEDIINLSHLDEGAGDMAREETDLYALAERTVQSLSSTAERAEVTLSLRGERAVVYGVPQLLHGILYNLCDNGIKYNRPQGRVEVSVENAPGAVRLTVADTGIGIPPEHQQRIFERFYRVDKSHSKEVGGTGLGLSIVKHAARIHDAAIDLQSDPGRGTVICVTFPAEHKEFIQ